VPTLSAVATSTSALTLPLQSSGCSNESSFLYSDLSSRYDVVDDHVIIGPHSFSMLRVRDTNALLKDLHPEAFAMDERLPYWAELWPSSIELARHCLEECSLCGKRVLEIGCGLGLAGVAAASAGAHVVFTDYEPDALEAARFNAIKNLPQDTVDSRIEFRLLDWRSDEEVGPVDMIIGADVVYERRNFLPVLKIARRVLKRDGCGVFTDPDRSTGMSFFALAEQEGFDVALSSRSLLHADKTSTILLGELRLSRQGDEDA
jgi:predicted nicotinamide N-methyase